MPPSAPRLIPWDVNAVHRHATGFLHPFVNADCGSKQLRMHVSAIDPGQAAHPPHQHAGEEIIYLLEGTAEALIGEHWERMDAPTALFCPEYVLHGIRNAGPNPMKYMVIRVPETT